MRIVHVLACAAVLTGCAASTPPTTPPPPASPPPAPTSAPSSAAVDAGPAAPASKAASKGNAPVLVAIVVDQLGAWVARERLPLLPSDGGFARLRREGTWVKDLAYLHAVTETAPGHAALFTGKPPHDTGIVGNAVYRKDLGKTTSLLEDKGAKLIGPDGATQRSGVSLANLRVLTLADALVAKDPEAVAVGLSLKDRGAAFGGGRHPAATVWYDEEAGTLATSSALPPGALPAWVKGHERPVTAGSHDEWKLFDKPFVEAHATTPDDQPGESGDLGGRVFPHVLPEGPHGAKAFRSIPSADALLADLALAAVDGSRKGDHPFLLAVSFSTNDYVGHNFGPDSWEAWDELRQLDATLARLFAGLDARLGADGYSVVLSGDHGIAPLPETLRDKRKATWCAPKAPNPYEKPCAAHARLVAGDLKKTLNEAIERAMKPEKPLVQDVVEALVFLTDDARALDTTKKKQLDAVVRKTLAANPEVAKVFSTQEFAASCPPATDESLLALVCRATVSDIGDYYIVPKAGSFFWGKPGAPAEGVSHGTPYRYDRTVPLLVRYPQGARGTEIERGLFGSYYASAWYALTGEKTSTEYGSVVGTP